ncbi:hypothetical protein OF385_15550 [Glutamicibacter sp. JL.03c]|uniref:hypothetical protein n=1 Tax=Glutamicibacter sp. JL.03c TaxID=2984842 RepID=UPI0021F7A956|nr:hypothetical protein [Glutamicibacter sp. JL.03c]UYQ77406.1 hypothetical protein OF385_15550 [Glutamicibacter sp. JL.03c]
MNILPCGRSAEDVALKLDEPADVHELQCQWCHAERQRLKDQNSFITHLLESSTPQHEPQAVSDSVLGKISQLIPRQKLWDVQDASTGAHTRLSSLDIVKAIRRVFAEATTIQLNYTEIKATDTGAPHRQWNVQCWISMAEETSVPVIEKEVLDLVREAITPLFAWNEVVVDLVVEDLHGRPIESVTLREEG